MINCTFIIHLKLLAVLFIMILTQTPLRISLGGGGTDLPSYYTRFGSTFISAAIQKYIYIFLHKRFDNQLHLKYANFETVQNVDDIKHDLTRRIFLSNGASNGIEVASVADIPTGTGLGSSGSFGVGLINAVYAYTKKHASKQDIAEEACNIEMNVLNKPVGKQDQYIAAFGGINAFEIDRNGKVTVNPLKMREDALSELQENLVLYYTGITRYSSLILKLQDTKLKEHDEDMIGRLHATQQLGLQGKTALENGDLRKFGELMHVHWENKKKMVDSMSSGFVDECYTKAMQNGAVGGKLIGAGGGGFLMFYTEDKTKLRSALKNFGLPELPVRFDFEGSKILINKHE